MLDTVSLPKLWVCVWLPGGVKVSQGPSKKRVIGCKSWVRWSCPAWPAHLPILTVIKIKKIKYLSYSQFGSFCFWQEE